MSLNKKCNKCKEEKAIDDFLIDRRVNGKIGYKAICKKCRIKKMKIQRQKRIKINKERGGFDKNVELKKCSKCKEIKTIEKFSYNIGTSDGFNYSCKQCSNEINEKYNKMYKEKTDKTIPDFKICFRCKDKKLISFFSKETKSPDGYSYKCKECHIKDSNNRRDKYKIINEQRGGFDKDLKEKQCKICKEIKTTENFVLCIYRKDGFGAYCKDCNNVYYKELRKQERHIKKSKEISLKKRQLTLEKKEKTKEEREKKSIFLKNERRKRSNASKSKKYHSDVDYNIKTKVGAIFRHAMKGSKSKTAKEYGIDLETITNKLKNDFGKLDKSKKYHIDHKFPVRAFDHTNEEMIKKCWHYNNLQWLEEIENLSKGDKYNKEEFEKYLVSNPDEVQILWDEQSLQKVIQLTTTESKHSCTGFACSLS